jgi:ABC-type Fe3+-hydroxamate transport system substrate-binding protein
MYPMRRTPIRTFICLAAFLLTCSSLFAASPRRIVSLAPSLTRQIYDLQMQDRLVGITSFCPSYAKGKDVIGSLTMLNFEKICSLKPDLVLASTDSNKKNDIEKLRNLGLKVEIFPGCETYPCMCREFRHLGSILGRDKEADRIIADVDSRIEGLRAKLPSLDKPRVFWQVGTSPLITASSQTFTGEIIRLAGGRNIFGSLPAKYPRINAESVVAKNPDVIFIVSDMAGPDDGASSWKAFRQIKAVSTGRIYVMDANLVCQPTPGMYLKAFEAVAAKLYPGIS